MNSQPDNHGRRGLTLMELVAALVLLSLLMAALSGLAPRFAARAADRTALATIHAQQGANGILNRLADDLANADRAAGDGAALHLEGLLERDPAGGRLTDRRGTCTYRIVSQAGRRLWLREQNGRRTLLGVMNEGAGGALVIEALLRDGQTSALARLPHTLEAGQAAEPVEPASRLQIVFLDAGGQPLAARTVVRRPLADGELALPSQAP